MNMCLMWCEDLKKKLAIRLGVELFITKGYVMIFAKSVRFVNT